MGSRSTNLLRLLLGLALLALFCLGVLVLGPRREGRPSHASAGLAGRAGPARLLTEIDEPPPAAPEIRAVVVRPEPIEPPRRRVMGIVLDREGNPCPDATVSLYSPSWSLTVDYCRSSKGGQFVLRCPHLGSFDVVAHRVGIGSCEFHRLTVTDTADPEIELELTHPDWLEGRLVDDESRPLAGVELWAFPAAFSNADSAWLFRWRMRPECRTLRGEWSGTTTTDSVGSFRFVGLEPGSYFIARRDRLDPPRAACAAHLTGASRIELVEAHTRLLLRCSGASGARAVCAPITRQGISDHLLGPSIERGAPDGVLFEVEPCRVYRCGFIDPSRGLVEAQISIPCRSGTFTHELTLPESGAGGRLVLERPSRGRPPDQSQRRIRVRSLESGLLLMAWTQGEIGTADLPAGEFLLEIANPPARGPEAFVRADPLAEQIVSQKRVVIEANRETRVHLFE